MSGGTPRSEQWTRRSDMPACCMAGTGLALGNDELLIVGGADGSLFDQADVLKDQHPGFPKQLYSYDCEGDRWTGIGGLPARSCHNRRCSVAGLYRHSDW